MCNRRGDVVWSSDPFKDDDTAGRPWLVVGNETQPFRDEQSMAVALTTSGHTQALPIEPSDWRDGGLPRRSYALPWAVHSPRTAYVSKTIGRLEQAFLNRVTEDLYSYIAATRDP